MLNNHTVDFIRTWESLRKLKPTQADMLAVLLTLLPEILALRLEE